MQGNSRKFRGSSEEDLREGEIVLGLRCDWKKIRDSFAKTPARGLPAVGWPHVGRACGLLWRLVFLFLGICEWFSNLILS